MVRPFHHSFAQNIRNKYKYKFKIVKSTTLFLATLATLLTLEGKAQEVSFRTEYIGNSGYYYLPPGEKPREKIGDRSEEHTSELQSRENLSLHDALPIYFIILLHKT